MQITLLFSTPSQDKDNDIIKFAGIEEFFDTSVKRYSSRMPAMLGFTVAAHFYPEISNVGYSTDS